MTRTEKFQEEVEQRFKSIFNDIPLIDRATLDENEIQEFARAEKVIKYISNELKLMDADLLPQELFSEIQKIPDWRGQGVDRLNEILDSYLIIINKYKNLSIPKNATLSNIKDILASYHTSLEKSLKALNLNKVRKDLEIIHSYEKTLNSENGIKAKIEKAQNDIQSWFNEIKKFNDDFFVKQEGKDASIKAEIEHIQNDMALAYKQFHDTMINFTPKLTDIDEFYVKIFGAMENNQRVGGLQQKIKDRQKQLDEYDEEQKAKFKSLKDEIESLLKDATNASLASSYEKSKESYIKAIYGWNAIFILSMLSIVGVAVWGFVEVADKLSEPLAILGAISVRLPFYIPLAWLAIFSTQRRNESKRLQEEYKHKETLARSFLGYKKQIDEIQSDSSQDDIDLAKKLMENLVEMTNENPNKSLDKIKKENMPMIEFFEKLAKSPEEARNLFKEFVNIFKKTN